jgi:CheY-like chemotaxis protein
MGDAERSLAAGMNDYISKPVQLDKLVIALEKSSIHGIAGVPAYD